MNIVLFKLNNLNSLEIDEYISISDEFYQNSDIRDLKDVYVKGSINIDFNDEVFLNLMISGVFILPCAITLEDVPYQFQTKIEESIGNFNDFYDKNKNTLDILPIIWENIVSEVPIRVVKEGVKPQNLSGDGWELISEDAD